MEGERFYLRAILQHRPACSFLDAMTVNDVLHGSFQEAAVALGLFADENEGEYALAEAVASLKTPQQIRLLFVHLLLNECLPTPIAIWEQFRDALSKDFLYHDGETAETAVHLCLADLATSLEEHGRRLSDFGLPEGLQFTNEVLHEMQKWGSHPELLRARATAAVASMTSEQASLYDLLVHASLTSRSMVVFIDGRAGRGKTFLVNALCDKLRSEGLIVLPTATAAFAAQLYAGGRTTHSVFKVPVNPNNEMLKSPISRGSARGDLIQHAAAIIWDEAPMANKAVLACVDDVCRHVMADQRPFGGKLLILLGDFRQCCPVIRGGSAAQVVDASITSSPLWEHVSVHHLTTPVHNALDPAFASYVDSIGDGAGPDISLHHLRCTTSTDHLIEHVFPLHVLTDPVSCLTRAILCPTHRQVDSYNGRILSDFPGAAFTFLAADSFKEAEDEGLLPPPVSLTLSPPRPHQDCPIIHYALRWVLSTNYCVTSP